MNKYQEAIDYLKKEYYQDSAFSPKVFFYEEESDYKYQVDTLQELVDKETPKKAIKLSESEYGYTHICPACDNYVGTIVYDVETKRIVEVEQNDYCPTCGQKLKWGEDDE